MLSNLGLKILCAIIANVFYNIIRHIKTNGFFFKSISILFEAFILFYLSVNL